MIALPENFSQVIQSSIEFMKSQNLRHFNGTDGSHSYRFGLLGNSLQIQITPTPRPGVPAFDEGRFAESHD